MALKLSQHLLLRKATLRLGLDLFLSSTETLLGLFLALQFHSAGLFTCQSLTVLAVKALTQAWLVPFVAFAVFPVIRVLTYKLAWFYKSVYSDCLQIISSGGTGTLY